MYFLLIILAIGLLWFRSSYGKFSASNFSEGFTSTITKFLSKNPYPWYKSFLTSTVLPNAQLFSALVLWGELLTALAIIIAIGSYLTIQHKHTRFLLLAGLAGGAFLNAMFWLASAWTSPSTDSLNLLMFTIEIIGMIYVLRLKK